MSICYVIGSGPSLTGFDFDALPGGVRIGANKSAWLAKCDILVTLDKRFHREFRSEIESFSGAKYCAVPPDNPIDGVTYVTHHRGDGFSDDPSALRGVSSGFAALNLAYLLGYTEIALLGFDYKWDGDKTHFHGGYTKMNKDTQRMLRRWVLSYDRTVGQLANKGVTVTNFVGPIGSNITAYRQKPLDDLY